MEKFKHFCHTTYVFDADTKKALPGATNHFNKALILMQIARQYAAKLPEDRAKLRKHGYNPAQRGRELSALIESILLDLYSSIDCARKVVTFLYKNHRGVKQSTRKFFKSIATGKVDDAVPKEIRDAFASATWYDELRRIRDALTHSDIGSCHLDEKTGKVFYMYTGLEKENKALIIKDIFAYIETLISQNKQFMGKIFHYLNRKLKDKEAWQMCGIFDGLVYSRWVRPSKAKDFNSGRCDAFKWFEKNENPDCPFMGECQAHKRRNNERDN